VTESFDVSWIRLEQREQVVEAYRALAKVVENDNFLVSVASEVFVEITDESYLLIHRFHLDAHAMDFTGDAQIN